MTEDAFGNFDPRIAQDDMDVESYADLLGKLKPAFIHHPESKRHLTAILEDLGCDLEKTYFDVPRMRSSTSSDYLTTGIGLCSVANARLRFTLTQALLPLLKLAAPGQIVFINSSQGLAARATTGLTAATQHAAQGAR